MPNRGTTIPIGVHMCVVTGTSPCRCDASPIFLHTHIMFSGYRTNGIIDNAVVGMGRRGRHRNTGGRLNTGSDVLVPRVKGLGSGMGI
jgi:hypothetical protein